MWPIKLSTDTREIRPNFTPLLADSMASDALRTCHIREKRFPFFTATCVSQRKLFKFIGVQLGSLRHASVQQDGCQAGQRS
jgi:hypothetical protein